jgi:hypothetical protein
LNSTGNSIAIPGRKQEIYLSPSRLKESRPGEELRRSRELGRGGIMIKRWIQANAVFLAVLTAIFIGGCHADTEQDKVKKVVHKVQQAAENKDIKQVLSHLSKTYKDPQGNNYDDVKDLLIYYFFRHAKVSVFITNLDVHVDSPFSTARFQAVLSGRNKVESSGDILPEAFGAYNFDVTLAMESGEWHIVSARWDRSGEAPLDKTP